MQYQQLIERHEALKKLYDSDVNSLRPSQVSNYLSQLRAAGAQIEPLPQRERLTEIAHLWDDYMRAHAPRHPRTYLAPYNSQAGQHAPSSTGAADPITALLNGANPAILLGLIVGAILVSGLLWFAFAPSNDTAETAVSSPTAPFTPAPVVATVVATPTAPPPTIVVTPVPTAITYEVQSGDALIRIAERFGITVDELREANNLTDDTIILGAELIIPVSPTPLPEADSPQETAVFTLPTPADGPRLTVSTADSAAVEIRVAPDEDADIITTVPSGEVLLIVFRTPSSDWYSVQLNDGYTRGWLPATQVTLTETAVPAAIPTFVPSP